MTMAMIAASRAPHKISWNVFQNERVIMSLTGSPATPPAWLRPKSPWTASFSQRPYCTTT
jgi:hypothetical protein